MIENCWRHGQDLEQRKVCSSVAAELQGTITICHCIASGDILGLGYDGEVVAG